MKFILTDVEGTTTAISFVHDVLFPFSQERMKEYIQKHASKKEVQEALNLTKKTALEENQQTINDEQAGDLLLQWIKEDRKHPALKSLQGEIWEEGYASGAIKGHVYSDVLPALKKWKENGLGLGVYSSGSVKAQHLIFGFSTEGNLRPFFSHHFDTAVGHKREVNSYKNIIAELKIQASDILFLSDIKEELDAAREAGMKTTQLVRQDDVVLGDHPKARDFSEIKL
ncbi:acireductone synthase [Bacteriovorax stolpii]|uniref:Enolase-phosphatase E1 n=1 Tax=Bacteriovorax stolpii TaxID=960 RepID=A0A2K9NVM4_BACTC|nr:acireductone synthase [Bacteriovorax stolpii]AUN99573.1 acireductone synthase [Bacteriovorax stolpii]QDK40431.1 acireductone synthase [Bacteriovorax stolpii]TDP51202.1 acireductone synthase [Bacteriovorax stolpii]